MLVMSDSLRITTDIDHEKWGEFVNSHPCGNIFQTPEMREVYERTKNYEPITLAAVDEWGDSCAYASGCDGGWMSSD